MLGVTCNCASFADFLRADGMQMGAFNGVKHKRDAEDECDNCKVVLIVKRVRVRNCRYTDIHASLKLRTALLLSCPMQEGLYIPNAISFDMLCASLSPKKPSH